MKGFELAGYSLRTDTIARLGVIEVYPHPALVELAGAAERLPYKALKGSELLAIFSPGVPAYIDNGARS
jgi:predicted RNase H-like nuclease